MGYQTVMSSSKWIADKLCQTVIRGCAAAETDLREGRELEVVQVSV